MNRLAATAMSLALGLTSAKCATDTSIGSHSQATAAYNDVVTGDIGRISTDASGRTDATTNNADTKSDGGKDVANAAPDKNPCKKLDPKWKTVLAGEYLYNPPPKMGADRATLEGVTKEQIFALAKLVNDNVVSQLCYAQETVNPVDPEGDAVRVCDSIEVQYNGEPTPDNEDVYVICHIKDPLPQGPELLPQYDKEIIEDKIGISANTALGFSLDPEEYPIGLNAPALYKTRMIEGVDPQWSPKSHSFFITTGDQDPKYGTGDFNRRSRIWISGK